MRFEFAIEDRNDVEDAIQKLFHYGASFPPSNASMIECALEGCNHTFLEEAGRKYCARGHQLRDARAGKTCPLEAMLEL